MTIPCAGTTTGSTASATFSKAASTSGALGANGGGGISRSTTTTPTPSNRLPLSSLTAGSSSRHHDKNANSSISSDVQIGSAPWLAARIGLHGRQNELRQLYQAYQRTVGHPPPMTNKRNNNGSSSSSSDPTNHSDVVDNDDDDVVSSFSDRPPEVVFASNHGNIDDDEGEEKQKQNRKQRRKSGCSEFVLLQGLPGVGKTHLVQQSFVKYFNDNDHGGGDGHDNQNDQVFFVRGKFEQLRSQQPYSAIHEAFSMLCRQLLSKDKTFVNCMIEQFLALGHGGGGKRRRSHASPSTSSSQQQQIIFEMFPVLREAIGYDNFNNRHMMGGGLMASSESLSLAVSGNTSQTSLSSSLLSEVGDTEETTNQFHFAFRNFLKAVTNYKPIVLFIDDLQWSDIDSLDLLKALLVDKSIKKFLVIGSCRSNEIGPGHYLNVFRNDLEKLDVPTSTMVIGNLQRDDVSQLIQDTFHFQQNRPQQRSQPQPLAVEVQEEQDCGGGGCGAAAVASVAAACKDGKAVSRAADEEKGEEGKNGVADNHGNHDDSAENDKTNTNNNAGGDEEDGSNVQMEERAQKKRDGGQDKEDGTVPLLQQVSSKVYESTRGNSFHVFRLLQYLLSEELLYYNTISKNWECKLSQLVEREFPPSVEDLITLEMHKQQNSVIQLLKIGAALGTYFDDYTVSLILRSGVDTLMRDEWGEDDIPTFPPGTTLVATSNNDEDSSSNDRSGKFSTCSTSEDFSIMSDSKLTSSSTSSSTSLRKTFQKTSFESLSMFRSALESAVAGGFLYENGKLGYQFCHDKVRRAAYDLIDEQTRPMYHLAIGRLMVQNASPTKRKKRRQRSSAKQSVGMVSRDDISKFVERQLFVAVDQLNRGRELIVDEEELVQLVSLNLRAAEHAASSASFLSSKALLEVGREVLDRITNDDEPPWQSSDDHYELYIRLATRQADVEMALGHHDAGEKQVKAVLQHARKKSETYPVQYALIRSLSLQEKFLESFKLSRSVLQELGVYPKMFIPFQAIRGYNGANKLLNQHTDEQIVMLQRTTDSEITFAMQLLRNFSNNAFMSQRMMDFLLGVVTRIKMTFDKGLTDESSYAFASHAVSLLIFGNQAGAVRCAGLATKLMESNVGNHLDGLVYFIVHRFVNSWSHPPAEVMRGYRRGYIASMNCGDVEAAFVNWYQSIWHAFDYGCELRQLLQSLEDNVGQAGLYGCKGIVRPGRLFVKCLKQVAGIEPLDWEEMASFKAGEEFEVQTLVFAYLVWLFAAVFFRKHSLAERLAQKLSKVASHDVAYNVLNLRLYYTGLVASAQAFETGKSKYIKQLRKCEKELADHVETKGKNCIHRQLILKALCVAHEGGSDLASIQTYFETAIAAAKKASCIPDVALAYEVAAEVMMKKQDAPSADQYLVEAYVHYLQWGASRKAREMETVHSTVVQGSQVKPTTKSSDWINVDLISSATSSTQTCDNEVDREEQSREISGK